MTSSQRPHGNAVRQLVELLGSLQFRRLFAVRVSSQLADGVFQVALASYVLFSPEKEPDAAAIAAALAIVLLPFTVLGPFVGVFLDRWPRRAVLAWSNAARVLMVIGLAALVGAGVPDGWLYPLVLACLSVNRFVLAGLSASLPHTVPSADLVTANALTPTLGSVAVLSGAGLGAAIASLTSDATALVVASLVYAGSVGIAVRIPRMALGPDPDDDRPGTLAALHGVLSGLHDGLAHLRARPEAAHGLLLIAATRFLYGLTTVAAILLYRRYLNGPDQANEALGDVALFIAASGLGFLLAALVTPPAVLRLGIRPWVIAMLLAACMVTVYPAMTFSEVGLVVTGAVLGLAAQGIKICVDTLVQVHIDDAFRGRVFALYDVAFNLAFLAAACVAAVAIPADGRSYPLFTGVALGYLVLATAYGRQRPAPTI